MFLGLAYMSWPLALFTWKWDACANDDSMVSLCALQDSQEGSLLPDLQKPYGRQIMVRTAR